MKRAFDFILALVGLVFILPVLIIVAILIKIDSKGDVFYKQVRVGRKGIDFKIFKFRTMHINADKQGLLTIGGRDPRVTRIGYVIRKYKLDELPQLINVLIGDMSLVGPRPEVRKYVELYSSNQKKVLNVRPGITDMASIKFRNENEILEKQDNPTQYYIDVIMPEKLDINLNYLHNRSFIRDIGVILKTIKVIFD